MLNKVQKQILSDRVCDVLGIDNLKKCSQNQLFYMDKLLDERLEELKDDPSKLDDKEIIGIYEMVTIHLLPYDELFSKFN